MKVNFENERPTVLSRDLHEFLEVDTPYRLWFPRMCEYGFNEGIDYTPYNFVHPQNHQEVTDHQLTIEMAKEIAMLQRNEKGKQARTYFIQLEKEWNSPEKVMARALRIADKKMAELSTSNEILLTENKLLSQQNLQWATRNTLNAIIKAYGAKVGFEDGWRDFKKELLYNHGININLRITNRMNETGKKTKPATLTMIHDDELSKCTSTAVALCNNKQVDISSIMNKFLEQKGA